LELDVAHVRGRPLGTAAARLVGGAVLEEEHGQPAESREVSVGEPETEERRRTRVLERLRLLVVEVVAELVIDDEVSALGAAPLVAVPGRAGADRLVACP